jgi:hypothetical protein
MKMSYKEKHLKIVKKKKEEGEKRNNTGNESDWSTLLYIDIIEISQ